MYALGTMHFLMLNCLPVHPWPNSRTLCCCTPSPPVGKGKDIDVAIDVGNNIYIANRDTQVARLDGRTKAIGWFKVKLWQQKDATGSDIVLNHDMRSHKHIM